jgi:predicted Fe-Mo cluster-binding NifX family protein
MMDVSLLAHLLKRTRNKRDQNKPKHTRAFTMDCIAVSVRGSKVAPIFDFSSWFLLVKQGPDGIKKNAKLNLDKLPSAEKVQVLLSAGVKTVICGCISDSSHERLEQAGIQVIWGITGSIIKVLEAFRLNRLDESPYRVLKEGIKYLNPPSLFRWI